MKFLTGIIRKLDALGRVVIPKEYRETLGIEIGDPIEISINGSDVIINKYENKCIFCGKTHPEIHYNKKLICKKCLHEINNITEIKEKVK